MMYSCMMHLCITTLAPPWLIKVYLKYLETTLSEKNPPAKTPKDPPPIEAPRIQ